MFSKIRHCNQYLAKATYIGCKLVRTKKTFSLIMCASVVSFITWCYIRRLPLIANKPFVLTRNIHNVTDNHPIPGENHMLFIESSCTVTNSPPPEGGGLHLTARQACAMESAARTNPNVSIYLLYTCPIIGKLAEASSAFVTRMLKYPNVRICRIYLDEYFEGTPLEQFYKSGGWNNSHWPRSHASDVLRYLTLWKYGGTYLDLDNIVIRSLADLGTNFVGAETNELLASGVLNLGMDQTGRHVANSCVNEVSTKFRGDLWGGNGPDVITRVIKRVCNANETSLMTPARCSGFTVHPRTTFYPIFYSQLDLLFEPSRVNTSIEVIQNSHMVHTWNHVSASIHVKVGSLQPMALLAQEFCPEVYQNCGPIF